MITLRKSADRGHFDHGWLNTYHTFAFGGYRDLRYRGFRSLRVINEDYVQPGYGFPEHDHQNMEIVTYVLAGTLAHRDSMGNGERIRPGDVQRMTAGSGITHSEMNPSDSETVHLLQIWLFPEQDGLEPGYEQKHFPFAERQNRLQLVASRDGRDGSLTIHQHVDLFAAVLAPGTAITHTLRPGRHAWLQLVRGSVELNGSQTLEAGDGAAISEESTIALQATSEAELLLFDLV
jgi:redox-sensitive bicupin YhaK (pirin superfamily)